MTLRVHPGAAIMAAALLAPLAGCDTGEQSAFTLEVTGNLDSGTAVINCVRSTSGSCHVLFRAGDVTKTASATVGATTTVTGLTAGMGICGGVSAPDPATCKPTVLVNGSQIMRHEAHKHG